MTKFRELLKASLKSKDTEEWLDVHFNRPIGLVFALFWNKLGVHPNAVTILSIFLGVAAGVMFYSTDLTHNIMGVVLLMFADFCDSTDGQMARLTGKKTPLGRILDGASGDFWFISIYFFICLRLTGENIPGTDMKWGIAIWLLAAISGILCHSPQSSLSDYYRQIHLFFLKGKEGSELDNSKQQLEKLRTTPKSQWMERLFCRSYANYCKSQERRTPKFQQFFDWWKGYTASHSKEEQEQVRQKFLEGSRPLMKFTNLLTFNSRAIVIYITCILGSLTGDTFGPWIYFAFEILILNIFYIYMWRKHEALCNKIRETYE